MGRRFLKAAAGCGCLSKTTIATTVRLYHSERSAYASVRVLNPSPPNFLERRLVRVLDSIPERWLVRVLDSVTTRSELDGKGHRGRP
jgi:hypothetical protein